METRRRTDIDIAKGIGIILVVWAHACGPGNFYITQFHMPFFFFVSGLLYSSEDASGIGYIARKGKALLLPFWWWNGLFLPLYFVLFYWGNWSIGVFVKEAAEILFTLEKVPFLGATWFLPALFQVSVIVHLMIRGLRKNRAGDMILLGASAAVCVLGFSVTFPHRISRTLICSFFYVCGYLYKKYFRDHIAGHIKDIGAPICGILYIIIASYNEVSLGGNEYRYKWAFIGGVFAATFFLLRLSEWLSNMEKICWFSDHLAYIGKNSMCIVIWHLLLFRVPIILQILVMRADLKAITAFPVYDASGLWWAVYIAAGIYLSLGWQYILQHNPLSPIMRKMHMI